MRHIVSFSGGKDSTAMLLRMIEEGWQIDEIIMINIMATKDLGGEFPEMYDFIQKVSDYCMKEIGMPVTIINHPQELTFESYFYREVTKGKNQGKIYGWPYAVGAWCNSRLKTRVMDSYFREQDERGEYKRYIGIAHDEPKRLERLKKNEIAPLDIWKMTEEDCLKYCKERGFYNPLYDKFKRLGCWFCPKQNLKSLRVLYDDYPELWQILLRWDEDAHNYFRGDGKTVHDLDERFKKEDEKRK